MKNQVWQQREAVARRRANVGGEFKLQGHVNLIAPEFLNDGLPTSTNDRHAYSQEDNNSRARVPRKLDFQSLLLEAGGVDPHTPGQDSPIEGKLQVEEKEEEKLEEAYDPTQPLLPSSMRFKNKASRSRLPTQPESNGHNASMLHHIVSGAANTSRWCTQCTPQRKCAVHRNEDSKRFRTSVSLCKHLRLELSWSVDDPSNRAGAWLLEIRDCCYKHPAFPAEHRMCKIDPPIERVDRLAERVEEDCQDYAKYHDEAVRINVKTTKKEIITLLGALDRAQAQKKYREDEKKKAEEKLQGAKLEKERQKKLDAEKASKKLADALQQISEMKKKEEANKGEEAAVGQKVGIHEEEVVEVVEQKVTTTTPATTTPPDDGSVSSEAVGKKRKRTSLESSDVELLQQSTKKTCTEAKVSMDTTAVYIPPHGGSNASTNLESRHTSATQTASSATELPSPKWPTPQPRSATPPASPPAPTKASGSWRGSVHGLDSLFESDSSIHSESEQPPKVPPRPVSRASASSARRASSLPASPRSESRGTPQINKSSSSSNSGSVFDEEEKPTYHRASPAPTSTEPKTSVLSGPSFLAAAAAASPPPSPPPLTSQKRKRSEAEPPAPDAKRVHYEQQLMLLEQEILEEEEEEVEKRSRLRSPPARELSVEIESSNASVEPEADVEQLIVEDAEELEAEEAFDDEDYDSEDEEFQFQDEDEVDYGDDDLYE